MKILIRLLLFLAIPTAAFLTFIAQPVIGKILTPRYGGSAGTWMTSSLFFQTVLLLGYAFAFFLLRKHGRRAFTAVIALSLLAPVVTILPPIHLSGWPEVPAILVGLVLSLGPALILTTSIGILLQGWIAREDGVVPYYLYGISNLGSTAALIAYPFWIEPNIPLSAQILALKLALGALGITAALLAWLYSRRPDTAVATALETPEKIPGARIAFWLFAAFSTCTIMLASIRLLSAELGSNPFSWVLPLSLYLLSFTATFTRLWRGWMTTLSAVLSGIVLFGYATTKGFSDIALTPWPLSWLLGVVGFSCLAGHAFLYQTRPAKRFPLFYLVLATGGALAGVCATFVFPLILDRSYEFLAVALLLWLSGFARLLKGQSFFIRAAVCVSLFAPVAWSIYARAREEYPFGTITHLRNYYGNMTVAETLFTTSVSSDTTFHGIQMKGGDSRIPTSYYTRGGGFGIVMTALQKNPAPLRIGAIGLGAGTAAAYSRSQDEIVFWEINPLAEKIAREKFTFLADAPGRCEVRMEDGRIGVRRDPGRFDVLLVDAFSGDSIPAHLLTREAINEYLAKLGDDGFLVIHISNRYFDLMPVLADSAGRAGWHVVSISAQPGAPSAETAHAAPTIYAIFYPPARKAELESWVLAALESSAITYKITPGFQVKPMAWTDERHAIIDVLRE